MSKVSLRTSAEFERVLRTGRRAQRDGVTVYVAATPDGAAPSRLGLAVRAPRAVDRNLIKRRIRGAWTTFGPRPGFEVAVRADAGARDLPYQELEEHLRDAFQAAGLSGRAS